MAAVETVEVFDPEGDVQRFSISSPRFVVGRLPELDIALTADGVSRQHAEFVRDPAGRWWVRDLNSRNGTRVNGEQVSQAVLTASDIIAIGPYQIRFAKNAASSANLTTFVGQIPVAADEPGALRSLIDLPAPQVQAAHLSQLSQFAKALNQTADPQERIRLLCELMTSSNFPTECAVAVRIADAPAKIEPAMLHRPVYAGVTARAASTAPMPYLSGRLLSAVRERRAPVMASNTGSRAADVQVSMAASIRAHAAIACPLGSETGSTDVLYVTIKPAGAVGEWLAIAGLAADQFQQSESLWAQRKIAAEHARLQHELEQARKVQEQLVPRKRLIAGVDYAIEFHPCSWVGGDYVDVIPLADNRVVFFIADVSGHGMQAALLASTIHAVINVLIPAGLDLDNVLRNLNDYLCRTLDAGSFATAICVELNTTTGKCRSLSAGHPPPLVMDNKGNWRALACGEFMPLGVQENAELTLEDDELPRDGVLALYTDGLFEIQTSPGEMLGYSGLGVELASMCKNNPIGSTEIASLCGAFIQSLQNGGMQADDQSLLIVRRQQV